MSATRHESDGETRLAYILGVPLAENVVRQWPQMGEIVRTSRLIAEVTGNFLGLTLEVDRRLRLVTSSWLSGPPTTATDACTATSRSVSCKMAKPCA
jgi:hypothetical protein